MHKLGLGQIHLGCEDPPTEAFLGGQALLLLLHWDVHNHNQLARYIAYIQPLAKRSRDKEILRR
jgi:hypothetical protein